MPRSGVESSRRIGRRFLKTEEALSIAEETIEQLEERVLWSHWVEGVWRRGRTDESELRNRETECDDELEEEIKEEWFWT